MKQIDRIAAIRAKRLGTTPALERWKMRTAPDRWIRHLASLTGLTGLAALGAIAIALFLTGCSTGESYDIPIPDWSLDYPQEVTPLSQAGCDGR